MRSTIQARKAFAFMASREGSTFSLAELCDATGWKASTARTYIVKLWKALVQSEGGVFRVRGVASLTEEEFLGMHSQVIRPAPEFDYEVGLSFAGEDREYVEEVASTLRSYDVTVFYDNFERANLWGKDLYEYLSEVYRIRCRFCVMFISEHYVKKAWPRHERRSAQARAFTDSREYMLPARFDDTEVPGMLVTTGFIDLRSNSPGQMAQLIAQKVGRYSEIQELLARLRDELGGDGYDISLDGDRIVFVNEREDYFNEFNVRIFLEMMRDDRLGWFLRSSIFVR